MHQVPPQMGFQYAPPAFYYGQYQPQCCSCAYYPVPAPYFEYPYGPQYGHHGQRGYEGPPMEEQIAHGTHPAGHVYEENSASTYREREQTASNKRIPTKK